MELKTLSEKRKCWLPSLLKGRKTMGEKGENAGNQHFLLFHNVFKSFLFQGR